MAFPCPSADPQNLIGSNHISKLLSSTELLSILRTIFHESGLGALDTMYGLIIFGSYSRKSIIQERYCGCNSAAQKSNDKTIILTANSYLDTILSSIFKLERYGIDDKEEQLTLLELTVLKLLIK